MGKITGRAAWSGLLAGGLAILCAPAGVAGAAQPPEGRAYELVSPSDKNGTDVGNTYRLSADGESFAWGSLGAYAGTRGANGEVVYAGRRTGSGWAATPFSPEFSMDNRPSLLTNIGANVFDEDLTSMTLISNGSFDPEDRDGFGQFGAADLYRVDPTSGSVTWISHPEDGIVSGGFMPASLAGVSDDGTTIFFQTMEPLTAAVPSDSTSPQLYRWRDGRVAAVGFDQDDVLLAAGSTLGANSSYSFPSTGQTGQVSDSLALSPDGSRFAYGGYPTMFSARQLYLHVDGSSPRHVSASRVTGAEGEPAATDVFFVTATDDLSTIYFQTSSQLTDDAPAGGGDYVYDVATDTLEFSHPSDSMQSIFSMSGVTRISQDGEYLYFVSTAVLADGAVADRRNLYVKHDGAISLIATVSDGDSTLASGAGSAGALTSEYTGAGLSEDGTRLVFESAAELAGAQTGGQSAIYLYDATTRALSCLSCRPDGTPSEGAATLKPPSDVVVLTPNAITADGSTVVFTTTDALAAADTNEVADVYEYRSGKVHLVSGGTSRFASGSGGISRNGRDLYFRTRQNLIPQDTDSGLADVYDARMGGGFPAPPEPPRCQGDECQGPMATPTEITPPASMNLPDLPPETDEDDEPDPVEPRFTVRALTRAQKTALARGGSIAVPVTTNVSGRIGITLRTKVGKRSVVVARRSVAAKRAGTVRVTLRLSANARRRLRSNGRLSVAMTTSFSKADKAKTQTFVLRVARVASRKGGTR